MMAGREETHRPTLHVGGQFHPGDERTEGLVHKTRNEALGKSTGKPSAAENTYGTVPVFATCQGVLPSVSGPDRLDPDSIRSVDLYPDPDPGGQK
jgi:hypothetical protein